MPIELTQESTYLHVDFALIFQFFELLCRVIGIQLLNTRRAQLGQARVEAEAALLDGSHLLKAKGHIVHSTLNQKPIAGVPLKHQSVKKGLGLL